MTISSRSVRPFAVLGLAAVLAATVATAATAAEKVLHSFQGGSDGAQPSGGLAADQNGNLYGATAGGGTGTGCYDGEAGCGTLFEIAKDGGETVLYSFQGGSDGISPTGSLLIDNSGNLYGTTEGGAGTGCAGYGCGTVFRLAPNGTETELYAFQGGSDGQFPEGGLIADQSGNLYGLTGEGGSYNAAECAQNGCGTVFEVQPNGTKITLYTFQAGTDGAFPVGGLIADASGNFYGTTNSGGGSGCDGDGCGTVFKLTSDGTETVLYAFQGGTDGLGPLAGLIVDSAGNFYGTTGFGGSCGCGTVFEVSPSGAETVLYSFQAGSDGDLPEAGLVLDKTGNLYGTTYFGGGTRCERSGCGVVFKLAPDGTETVMYTFDKVSRGRHPLAGLLPDKKGFFYGTTLNGGYQNNGVVFRLKK
jgi:uncharacterized repeat protein (TIGR03803 family)